ncbi:CPBP family intramembrane metalloprotease [Staphylococcus schleiferi subsp. coagulans]|uniref:intramembrane glutamic endopeptidase MroQ n=1 Tax=Staphylococcus coagulans TaxID=74706 RepID=UPI0015FAE400|nr:type II CAAX endopeptidase family protein [Staphylococcus coagulans]MBA8760409.1 CPBP family intramembrane metalloprotease [Staphylococcus coagulans]MBA8769211.1 CPBP family intramembrane metalloprotease [Staphylococcus coagulans]
MNRILVSILTVVFYILALFTPTIANALGWIDTQHRTTALHQTIYIQLIAFLCAAIIILVMQYTVKNKLAFELEPKEKKRYIVPWILAGLGIVYFAQIIVNVLSVLIFGTNPVSENTFRILKVAREMPIMIILIAIIGPLLEEFVFRKVLFGEIYNAIRANKTIKFLIATTISSLLFAVAHMDFSHLLVYFVMGVIFSAFYIYTKRLSVSIGIHMAQNGLVALIQLTMPEKLLEDAMKQVQFIQLFVIHFL